MADLIDRQALYEKTAEWEATALHMVEKTMNDEDQTEWRKWTAILGERTAFKHDVADAPSAQPEPRWIPMAVKYPSDGQLILVQFFNGYHEVIHFSAVGLKDHIEAWMPLPKPYKEDSDG